MKRHGKNKIRLTILLVILVILLGLAGGALFVWQRYQIREVYVEGNTHYTDDEIIAYVMTGKLDYNSIYLSLKYKNKEIHGLPFVQSMDIKILSRNSVKITVYEKSLAGYVQYLGRYLYFDKDGIVVESTSEKTEGVPQVSGLSFDSVTLYEKLPVEDDSVFGRVLSITQLLSKHKLVADRIYFSGGSEMTLYFGNVRVALGTSDYIDEKITRLQQVLPSLAGKSGVLDMRNYQDSSGRVTFTPDQT